MEDTTTLSLHDAADSLGAVRAEIRELKAREAALRRRLIDARPNGAISGRRFEVVVRESRRRVFDRDSLPKAILGDHRFWMTRVSQTVVTRALDGAAADKDQGGLPVGSARAPAAHATQMDLWGHESGLVLIEDF